MNTVEQSLEVLIATARAGDNSALGTLLHRYRPILRLMAAQAIGPTIGRRFDPSDVVQQTCIEALEAFNAFEGTTEPTLSAWLKQILRRNVANLVRDNKAAKRDVGREQPLYHGDDSATLIWFEPAGKGSTPSQKLINGEAAIWLATALETLPPDQRVAVRMRYLEARPLSDIAQELTRSTSAVAGLLHRGLRSLRPQLDSL